MESEDTQPEKAQPEKTQAQKSQAQVNAVSEKKSVDKQTVQLVNDREEAANNQNLNTIANNGSDDNNIAQLKSMASDYSAKKESPIQLSNLITTVPDKTAEA
jgi:hypothetical protein